MSISVSADIDARRISAIQVQVESDEKRNVVSSNADTAIAATVDSPINEYYVAPQFTPNPLANSTPPKLTSATTARNLQQLFQACCSGNTRALMNLLVAGVPLAVRDEQSASRFSALHCAAAYGHVSITELLLQQAGLLPDTQKQDIINSRDAYGQTALMIAAAQGHLTLVSALVGGGADIGAVDSFGRTAISVSASNGYGNVSSRLIKALIPAASATQQTV